MEKLSIKIIFNVNTVLASLPSTMLRASPELYETNFGTRDQQQGASVHVGQDVEDSSCSRAEQGGPAPQQTTVPKLMRGMSAKTPTELFTRKKIALNCRMRRPEQSFRSKSPGATIVPEDSASQADTDDMDDFETKGGFRWLTPARKLQVLKSKLPLETGIRLGRSECAVRAYLTNGIHDKGNLKLLRNYLKQVGGGRLSFVQYFCRFAVSSSSDDVGMFLFAIWCFQRPRQPQKSCRMWKKEVWRSKLYLPMT